MTKKINKKKTKKNIPLDLERLRLCDVPYYIICVIIIYHKIV